MNNSLPQSSGIYRITCIVNNKIYIGSAVNLYQRWNRHMSELRRGKHKNNHLQNAWNKYGEENFSIEVLEFCGKDELMTKEQDWIDQLRPHDRTIGFNKTIDTRAPMRGFQVTDETREKLRRVHLGKPKSPEAIRKVSIARTGKKLPPEHCANISKAKKGTIVTDETREKLRASSRHLSPSPETIKAMILAHQKTYIVTTPDGKEIEVTNLAQFCRKNGLNYQVMNNIANKRGKSREHKGYKVRHV